jgi:hypothetical protein
LGVASSFPVTRSWKRSNSRIASPRLFPATAAVMSEADAFEMAHPLPRKLASAITSPSRRSHTVIWSPHTGFLPSARRSASSIARKFRGLAL